VVVSGDLVRRVVLTQDSPVQGSMLFCARLWPAQWRRAVSDIVMWMNLTQEAVSSGRALEQPAATA
jgi:hypothetical protein